MGGSIGWAEIAVVIVLALIIFGPKKLPELGSALGRSIRGFRKGLKEGQQEIQSTVSEVKEAAGLNEVKAAVTELKDAADLRKVVSVDSESAGVSAAKGAGSSEN